MPLSYRTIFPALVLSIFVASGCAGGDQLKTSENHPSALRITSEQELRNLLSKGMTTNEIVLRCGEPASSITNRSGIQWLYNLSGFPADGSMKGTYVVGALLSITNGRLASLGFSYLSPSEGKGRS